MRITDPTPWLEKLEEKIDPEKVMKAQKLQEAAWNCDKVSSHPLLVGSFDDMSKERSHFTDWPIFRVEETLADVGKMLLNELGPAYEGALLGDDKMYTVRANYGVGIIPSLFGCAVNQEGDEYPWVESLETDERIRAAIKKGAPDINGGLLTKVIETQEYYKEAMRPYPKISKAVHIALCDIQGPFNLAFEVVGTRIFTDLMDDPKLVHDVLELTTAAFIAVATKEKNILGEPMDSGWHYQYRIKGGVRICEDNALSISPAMYEEHIRQYNVRAFAPFGGGYFLVCGGFGHVMDKLLDTPGARGLCYWSDKPEELLIVHKATRRRNQCLLWYHVPSREVRDQVDTGLVVKARVGSLEEGRRILNEWRS